MKLNLDFSLYKGTTRLKQWWKEVKAHFTKVQEAHNALEDTVSAHKTAAVLDHPDKSVTTAKIADKAVGTAQVADGAITQGKIGKGAVTKEKIGYSAITADKIADESIDRGKLSPYVWSEIAKASDFIYYDGEPVYLSECEQSLGYELPEDIPVNVFFKLENDTDRSLSEFRTHDDYYTPLSCTISPDETRICVLLSRAVGGADPQNGYLFVLDDTDTKSLINKEILERKNADNSLQKTITTLQNNINDEISERKSADTALDGRIKTVRKDMYGVYIIDGSFSDSDFQVQVDSSYSNATVTVTAGKSIKINGVQVSLPAAFTINPISPDDNVVQVYAEYDTEAKT
ncbi:MAG: hypothetical protein MR413_08900, partial [Clostridia bacterium]|nr:hypothetical protein [Clostridia bacterium]